MGRLSIIASLLFSLTLLYISNRPTNYTATATNLESYLNSRLVQDSTIVQQFLKTPEDRQLLSKLKDSPFYIEIFNNDTIVFWTDRTEINELAPDEIKTILKIQDSLSYADIKLNISGIYNFINPDLIQKENVKVSLNLKKEKNSKSTIKVGSETIFFTLENAKRYPLLKGIAWVLLFIVVISLTLIQLNIFKVSVLKNKTFSTNLIIIALILFLFKLLNSFEAFKHLFTGFAGFYSLNEHSTLTTDVCGLLINLWIFGTVIYLFNFLYPKTDFITKYKLLITFGAGFITFSLFGIATHLIEGFVLSKEVNLEIESLLQFNTISFALIISFSILMLLIFQSTHFLYSLLGETVMPPLFKYGMNILGWLVSLIIFKYMHWLNVPLWIFSVFVIAYILILDAYTENKEQKITYLIWWLIMFSGFLAVCLFYFGLKKDIAGRAQFLDKYFVRSDDKIVSTLNELNKSLVNSGIFSEIATIEGPSKLDLKDLEQYINQKTSLNELTLERSIELFDKKGNTLFSNHFANYYKTNQSFKNARQVAPNVYHNPFEDKYILKFEIALSNYANTTWYLFIIHQNSDIQKRNFLSEKMDQYGFAVFNQNRLIEKNEANQVMPDISIMKNLDTTIIKDGYSFVVSIPFSQFKLVSYKKVSGLIKPISLFSFIFTLSGLILLLLSLINTKYDFLPSSIALKFGSRSSLKTKIQLAIIILILITFMIIGAITGFYFKNLIEVNQKTKNKEETVSIINNIDSDIQNMPDDESALQFLNSKLKEFSLVHDNELSLFNKDGELLGSSIKGINRIRIPMNLWETNNLKDKEIDSSLSQLYDSYNTEFVPIFLNDKKPLAYLGIAHKSFNNSSKSILDFLSTILNAYIFLFLIAGAMAITIANSITQPLSILTEKLKKFKLGKTNELLEWNSNDEIGTLIHDYNNLTHELERSAGIIAKTERDMAWREMAKQVAHEIKNPLTPMKLSIQYLDRTAKEYPDKARDLIPRISSTLIEQIDNLSQIANEFSNFASMPQASNEKIILNEIVETIHDLFRKREDMDINMIEPIDDLYVFADKNHLVRILNNLLKNAIQAIPEGRRGKIEIELHRQGNDAVIRVSDNGIGIPEHMKDKVFTPNFTTKSSGTGLGLAISANMIESFNGKIYFETKPGQGTDFFVSIPLMRLDDISSDEVRVSLD